MKKLQTTAAFLWLLAPIVLAMFLAPVSQAWR